MSTHLYEARWVDSLRSLSPLLFKAFRVNLSIVSSGTLEFQFVNLFSFKQSLKETKFSCLSSLHFDFSFLFFLMSFFVCLNSLLLLNKKYKNNCFVCIRGFLC